MLNPYRITTHYKKAPNTGASISQENIISFQQYSHMNQKNLKNPFQSHKAVLYVLKRLVVMCTLALI